MSFLYPVDQLALHKFPWAPVSIGDPKCTYGHKWFLACAIKSINLLVKGPESSRFIRPITLKAKSLTSVMGFVRLNL